MTAHLAYRLLLGDANRVTLRVGAVDDLRGAADADRLVVAGDDLRGVAGDDLRGVADADLRFVVFMMPSLC